MITIELTQEQRDQIIRDYKQKIVLRREDITRIATKLNKEVNFPLLKEDKEQILLEKIVKRIDQILFDILPEEIYECLKMKENGIDPKEAEEIKERIIRAVNKKIDLPFLNEQKEKNLIRFVIDIIVNAMTVGKTI